MSINLAVYQGGLVKGVAENLALMEQVLAEASQKSVDLVVFSELFLQGYCAGSDLREFAEIVTGDSFQRISKMAVQYQIGVVYGYSEREKADSDVLYNSCAFVAKDGSLLANYRKTHLWGDYEKSYYTPGNTFLDPVDFMGIKTSMLICFDIEFPEPARLLSLKGAQLLLVPTALVGLSMTTITVPSRALENHIFVAYANRSGPDTLQPGTRDLIFCGNSLIAAPSGEAIARAPKDRPELIIATVDVNEARWVEEIETNPYLTSRRGDLYH